jgi:hypothetical protein
MDVATVGDEQPVAVANRPEIQDAFRQTNPRTAISQTIDYTVALFERAGDLIMVTVQAADADPDMRAAADAGSRATRQLWRTLTQTLHDVGALRPGLTAQRAADILCTLASPHTHQLLRRHCRWTTQRYHTWLTNAATQQLLPDVGDRAATRTTALAVQTGHLRGLGSEDRLRARDVPVSRVRATCPERRLPGLLPEHHESKTEPPDAPVVARAHAAPSVLAFSWPVTHGDIWLPSLLPALASRLLIISSACRRVRLPRPLPRRDPDTHRVRPASLPPLVHRPEPRPARRGPGGHRTVPALAAGRPPLPALDNLVPAVGRGRFLPRLRHRPDPGALAADYVHRPTAPAESHPRWGWAICSSRP